MKKLLTLQQTAEYLGVSKSTLRRWDKSGSLVAIVINDAGHRRYRMEDLERFTRKGMYAKKD